MTDHNDFCDLESTLRNALAKEKQKGLAPSQLQAMHQAIESGSGHLGKGKRAWWQWSLAGTLATAMIAFVVVSRFPDSANHQTETNDSWTESKETPQIAQTNQKAGAPGSEKIDGSRSEVTAVDNRFQKKASASKKPFPKTSTTDKKIAKNHSSPKFSDSVQLSGSSSIDSTANFKASESTPGAPPAASPQTSKLWNTPSRRSNIYLNDEIALQENKQKLTESTGKMGSGSGAGVVPSKRLKDALQKELEDRYKVRITAFTSSGSISATNSVKVVSRNNINQLRFCYQTHEQRSPAPSGQREGSLRIKWKIDAKGLAKNLKIPSGSKNLTGIHDCILTTVKRWRFPPEPVFEVSITVYFQEE